MSETNILRKQFGEHLEKLGGKIKNLVVLDSDLSNGLYTLFFAKAFPDQHFSLPQSESSMLGMAAGMVVRKKVPWVCAESPALLGKALDIVRNGVALPNLNIKIVLSNVGLGNIKEGAAHTCTEDLAILKSIPNLKIFTPADQHELRAMMDFMSTDYGPTILRISHQCHTDLYDENYQFMEGEISIAKRGEQACLFTYGNMLHESLQAASKLQKRGLSVQVINLSSLAPLNEEHIADMCKNFDLIATVEDHNIHGGIGSTIAEILFHNNIKAKLIKMGLDTLPESGTYSEILQKNGLNSKKIYETFRENWLQG
jgi:transketolase